MNSATPLDGRTDAKLGRVAILRRCAGGAIAAIGLLACIAVVVATVARSATAVQRAAVLSRAVANLRLSPVRSRSPRAAIAADASAYDSTLAHARPPKWAGRATTGPALDGLRSLAARLRRDGVTVGWRDPSLRIDSVSTDQAGTRATATVIEFASVRYYRNGRALGPPRALAQGVKMTLVRPSTAAPFRVWNVATVAQVATNRWQA